MTPLRVAVCAVACVVLLGGCQRWRHHHGQHAARAEVAAPPTLVSSGDATCVLDARGEVSCWGGPFDGATATRFPSLAHAQQIVLSATDYRPKVCGVMPGGSVRCIDGSDDFVMPRLHDVVELALQRQSVCARTAHGDVSCDLVESEPLDAVPVSPEPALAGAVRLAADHGGDAAFSSARVCAIVRGGAATCSADGTARALPGAHYVDVALNDGVVCLVSSRGELACFDLNQGTPAPVPTPGMPPAARVAVGARHVCVASRAGELACIGHGEHGQLGVGLQDDALTAIVTPGITGATEVAAGDVHTCARARDGAVSCVGTSASGALGPGTLHTDTTFALPGVVGVSLGDGSGCARDAAGALRCFGDNEAGQLADATATWRATPVRPELPGVGAIVDVSFDYGSACALQADGGVACWAGLRPYDREPVDDALSSVRDAVAMTHGGLSVWVARADATVAAYDPSTGARGASVTRLAGVARALTASRGTVCALVGDGVQCVGHDYGGECGDGGDGEVETPAWVRAPLEPTPEVLAGAIEGCHGVRCTGRLSDVEQLEGVAGLSCARMSTGRVACWGPQDFGPLEVPGGATRVPLYLPGITDARDLCVSSETCVRHDDGRVTCIGHGLGPRRRRDRAVTVHDLPALRDTTALACDGVRVCGVRAGSEVVCVTPSGELGMPSLTPHVAVAAD